MKNGFHGGLPINDVAQKLVEQLVAYKKTIDGNAADGQQLPQANTVVYI